MELHGSEPLMQLAASVEPRRFLLPHPLQSAAKDRPSGHDSQALISNSIGLTMGRSAR